MKFHARAYRPKLKKGAMNRTESEYASHLEKLKWAHEIENYSFEPETLKLAPDCRYTPDFRVLRMIKTGEVEDGSSWYDTVVEFHEVKGTSKGKPYIEDDALVKIKTAAEIHPMYKFILVWKGQNGNWETREIN